MLTYRTQGVPTQWPFKPYDQQIEYCEKVIQAIREKKNAILESPTGTGKTMSLLVSSLAWLNNTSEGGLIYYLSRTHIQLSQAAKEMKKTAYAGTPAVVLASRKQLCLNKDVTEHSNDSSINRACQNAIAKNSCDYFTGYEDKLKARLNVNNVHDIEDLHQFGRANQCCPFYASKKIAETQAALVFMPYNYVLDLSVRKSTQLKLDKSVILIDEGHNIEGSLKDAASGQISLISLKVIQECCEKIPHKLSEALMREHGLSRKKTSILDEAPAKETTTSKNKKSEENKPSLIEELSAKLTTDKLQQVSRCARILMSCQDLLRSPQGVYNDTKCSIDTLFKKLDEAGINFGTSDAVMETLDSMSTFWSVIGVVNPQQISKYVTSTSELQHFISLVFPPGTLTRPKFDDHIVCLEKNFSVYMIVEMEKETVLKTSNRLANWRLNLWCLNPAIGMRRVIDDSCLIGPRSIIITSGTLAPISQLSNDLGKKFDITHEFGHLITENQMKITMLSHSPDGYSLKTSYDDTMKKECRLAIGKTLSSLLRVLPFGTLVFFPSYRLLRSVSEACERETFWNLMRKSTNVFLESQDQNTFQDDMLKYKKLVDANGRAVFMGVCRGKLSEGTNLVRNHCRSVVIVGLPYPNYADANIIETKQFHNKRGEKQGDIWYTSQMKRALSQAIGRIIRSKDDFGMVFLCDPRFSFFKMTVSKWIQEYYPNFPTTDFNQIGKDVEQFFAKHGIDVNAASLARPNLHESGAFEFDNTVRRKPVQSVKSKSGPGITANAATRIFAQSEAKQLQQQSRAPTLARYQENMMAAYTVDSETYNRIKNSRKRQQETEQGVETKRPRTNEEVVESIFSGDISAPETTSDTNVASAPTQNSNSAPVPVPMKQSSQAGKSQCYVCLNESVKPYVINCKCARIGCYSCIKGLNNKSCGVCDTKLKVKQFKPKLFNIFKKS